MMVAIFASATFASTVGFNYSRAVEDTSWGVHGDYEKALGGVDLEIEGQLQSGDVYKGDFGIAVTLPIGPIGFRVASANDLKGYSLDGLGRVNNLSGSFVFPIRGVEVLFGAFGRNGNPFANPNLLDTAVSLGFIEDELVAIGAADIYPEDRGLTLPDGSAVGISAEASFDVSRFEVSGKVLGELFGEGEKVHKAILDIETGGALGSTGVRWTLKGNIAGQLYGDRIEFETGAFGGAEYPF